MRTTIIFRYVGLTLVMVATLMLASALVAFLMHDRESLIPLLYSAFITFIVGGYPLIFTRHGKHVSKAEGYHVVVFSWLAACIFGMLPYLCFGKEFTPVNSLFESVSGFTTTGASILDDIEAVPAGLLFWRMATSWIGGIGIVAVFSLFVSKSHDDRSALSGSEISNIASDQTTRRGKNIVRMMLVIYTALTTLCTLSLHFTGMDWFDAITNAMSTCSTCGFCIKNASIAAYDNAASEIVLIVFMIISGVSFIQIYSLLFTKDRQHARFEVTRVYLLMMLVATLGLTADLLFAGKYDSFLSALRPAAFQVASLTTTTGFATADTNVWPNLGKGILVVCSLICGCSGSTAGGIKVDRMLMVAKNCKNELYRIRRPHAILGIKMNGSWVSESMIRSVNTFIVLYLVIIILGTLVNIIGGLDLTTAMSASIACVGNVGPGFGDVSSVGNYTDFPAVLKCTSMAQMLLGRLEIIPILLAFGRWKE
ncbi:MAG: TrkH family potassium uptake protein [Bacteroidales bacterium]|nr:TrkH family potassium uptake protein [Bacteroidales bacterium]